MKRLVPFMGVLGLALAAGVAFAQPANDACTGAIDLSGSTFPTLTNPEDISTADPIAEFAMCGAAAYTIWYKVVPVNNGTLTAATCNADAPATTQGDTVIGLFESADGTCDTMFQIACNDDFCDGLRSSVSSPVTAGVTYYIQTGKYAAAAPAAGAMIQLKVTAPNLIEPPTGQGQATPASVDNCESSQVTFEVYTTPGSLPAATATIDLSAIGGSSAQAMIGPDGIGYFFVNHTVPGGWSNAAYNIPFRVADSNDLGSIGSLPFTVTQCPPPAATNDFCTDAIDVSSHTSPFTTDPVAISGNELAPEAVMCAFDPSQTVWYKLHAGVTGQLEVSTCAAQAPATNIGDTVLAVYESFDGSCDSLNVLSCVDDSCGLRQTVSVNATAGTWYYIQAAKYNGAATPGADTMQLFISPPAPPPPGTWFEAGDAGDLPNVAQVPEGSGALTGIRGSTDAGGTADMYLIDICSSEEFSASTVGGATIDTQLWLFNLDGTGVVFDDDAPAGTLQSTLTNAFVFSDGQYYLAISAGFNNDANDGDGQLMWANTPFNVERAPDGPGAFGNVSSWTGAGTGGSYTITLTGTCFPGGNGCPACAADFNQDGGVDGSDVEAFFIAWESGESCGDVNEDGGVDGSDVEAFFIVWEAGGC